jgi:hypothetical protein
MELEDLTVGMEVRIISWDYRPDHWAEDGEMDEWRGEVVTIAEVYEDSAEIFIEEDECHWQWYPEDFEPYVTVSKDDPNFLYQQNKRNRRIDEIRKALRESKPSTWTNYGGWGKER